MKHLKTATGILFTLILLELCTGGGGRLLAIGPVTVRMMLFALAMLSTSICLLSGQRLPRDYRVLLLLFGTTLGLGVLTGFLTGAAPAYVWEDVKPLLYFLILPFFFIAVPDEAGATKAATVIKLSAKILSIAFFAVLILIHTGLLPFLNFYRVVFPTGEFFFRGELTFFYKGFLYLCIGFIFFHLTSSRPAKTWMVLVMLAIVLSFTRGFLLALGLTYSFYYFVKGAGVKGSLGAMAGIVIIVFGQMAVGYVSKGIDTIQNMGDVSGLSGKTTLLGDRSYSDSGRKQQITEVFGNITPVSIFVGHGFGNGVPSRPVHMEISYLEIFHKQGLVGLCFWGYLLYVLFDKYRRARDVPVRHAVFFGSVFVFFQSLTNQFINNPIGMTMVLLAIVSLDRLRDSDRK